ncbi:MAG: HEAT repeat domain-containing protein [Chloroflexi bacterium]|nr:HEAT repeat domain-containing protein [Chloroflexota bacterium]
MRTDFELALEALRQDTQRITSLTLSRLSAPSRAERAAFARLWETFDVLARRAVVTRLAEAAEDSVDLDYADLYRLFLGDADAAVRRSAIDGLWEDERLDLVATFMQLLAKDPDDAVRAAAATALGRFVFMAECDELEERHGAAIRSALEGVVLDYSQPVEVARRALESLAHINDERVRGMIDWAYEQGDELLRISAVFAMGRSADATWAETVLEELASEQPALRYEAARACGEIQITRAVEPLIALANGSDDDIRMVAIWSLGQIGGDRARRSLERLAESRSEIVAQAAEDALAELEFCTRDLDLLVTKYGDAEMEGEHWSDDEDDDDALSDEDGGELEDDADDWEDEPLDLDSE